MDEEKKTPYEWEELHGFEVLDPDGWRQPGDPSFKEPLTEADFLERAMRSTIKLTRPGGWHGTGRR